MDVCVNLLVRPRLQALMTGQAQYVVTSFLEVNNSLSSPRFRLAQVELCLKVLGKENNEA